MTHRFLGVGLMTALALAALPGCSGADGESDGSGTATFTAWGEDYIEDGDPRRGARGRLGSSEIRAVS